MSATGSALALALCAAVLAAGPAVAQGGGATAEGSGSADVNDIVVTAQKRSENIQKVPLTIQAFSGAKLEATGIKSVDDLPALTPGLVIPRVGSGATPFIRGVGSAAAGGGQETAIATYVDGAYHLDSWAVSIDTSDVERIEVLKGPQGTLFGRNATGGVINVITRDPVSKFGGSGRVYFGDYKRYGGDFYVTGGLAENLAANLAVAVQRQDEGFGRNVFPNPIHGNKINFRDLVSVRGKVKWDNGDTAIVVSGDYSFRHDDAGIQATLYPGALGADGVAVYNACATPLGPDATQAQLAPCVSAGAAAASKRPKGFYDINNDYTGRTSVESYGGYIRVTHNFGGAKFLSLSSYRHDTTQQPIDNDHIMEHVSTAAPFVYYSRSFTQELQLSSDTSSPFQWIGGLFYLHARGGAALHLTGSAYTPLDFIDLTGEIKTNSYSAFGEVSYKLDKLKLTLGGRYTKDERKVKGGTFLGIPDGTGGDIVAPAGPLADQKKNFSKFTFRAVADYSFTPDVNAYASFNRGFKSGNFNAISAGNPAVKPEIVDAYEIGLKTQFFDRRLTFNIAGFYYNYSNLQLLVVTDRGTALQNAAKAKIKGVDVDANFRATKHITIFAGFERLDGKYKSFPNEGYYVPTGYGGNMLEVADLSGNQMTKAPKFTSNLGGTVTLPTDIGEFHSTVSWAYNSGFPWDPDGRLRQKSYSIVNALIGWQSTSSGLGASISVRNLTKAKYCVFCTAISDSDYFAAGQPRTITGEITYKF